MSELKACPFCGGEAEKTRTCLPDAYSDHDIIACKKCNATMDNASVKDWNTRPEPEVLAEGEVTRIGNTSIFIGCDYISKNLKLSDPVSIIRREE